MTDSVKISLVTTCKGRLSYLKESIPTWLNLDYDNYEIVVVDYDCPDGTEKFINRNRNAYLKQSRARTIRVVKVHDKPYFNLNDARNTGADAAEGELVFVIDSDVHIRDKKLLRKITNLYKQGIVFFCNPAVLTTNYREGHEFYLYKYGVTVPFHAFLPCHCKESGLTGTACFAKEIYTACGKYDAEINKFGWGSDDIEFYLRYLNYYFYAIFMKRGRESDEEALIASLERAWFHIKTFSEGTFRLFENTEEEKEKNYPHPKQQSNIRNKEHIRQFFNRPEGSAGDYIARKTFFKGKSVFKYGRYRRSPLPPWFDYWYLHWFGSNLYNEGKWVESRHRFLEISKMENVPPYYRWYSLLFAALIGKRQNKRGWKIHYQKGVEILKKQRIKSELEQYNIASLFKSFENYPEAEKIFKRLAAGAREIYLRAGACFHLGETAIARKDFRRAKEMFEKTLTLNQTHKKASDYLKDLR
jgi:glycosyltransferase involved in cell wall biosynthesis